MVVGGVVAVIFGLLYGSFLNVVILRFDDWLSIVKMPSHCPKCKTRLGWLDLIPVLSYLSLRGKCRYCQRPISWQYPVVELAAASLVGAGYIYIFAGQDLPFWREAFSLAAYVVVIGAALVIFFHDLYEMMIPDVFSNLLLVASVVFALIFYSDALGVLYSGLLGFLPIALLAYPSGGKWMGEGDVKLSTALAVLVGWPASVAYLALSFIGGGVFGVTALATKKVGLKSPVPFGPFLILAAIIAFFYGQEIIGWYFSTIGYGYY